MPASDVPGYVKGYVFRNDPAYFNGTDRFLDQAGYGAFNDLEITAGTPTFSSASGFEGLVLDNTCQGEFIPAIPWEGTVVIVDKPSMTVNGSVYPLVMGSAASVASNGTLRIVRTNSTDIDHRLITNGSALSVSNEGTTNDLFIGAFSTDQETRKGFKQTPGSAVGEAGPVGAAVNGNGVALGYHSSTTVNAIRTRFGNLSGTIGDVAASTNTMTIFELHFFQGNPMVDDATDFTAFLAELAANYTIGGADTTPNQFTFTDVSNAALSTVYESNTVTIAGLGASAAVTITGGDYSKNGGAYTSSAGTATNGDTFKVRHTSSASNSTATNTVLTIGGVSDTYTTTTLAAAAGPTLTGNATGIDNGVDLDLVLTGITDGTLFIVFQTAATDPDKNEIENGLDGNGAAAQAAQEIPIMGHEIMWDTPALADATAYEVHAFARDEDGVTETAIWSDTFTTL